MDRQTGGAKLIRGRPLSDELIVHPVLGVMAGVFGWWLGRETLHAGAAVVGSTAVGVLAVSGGGKTTLMGAAALSGLPVLTDDTLVVVDGEAARGARCVDLRPSAAAHLGVREFTPVRRRSRLSLGPAPRQVPLSALVSLAWGPRAVTALPPAERYRRIVQQSVTQPPADAARHLALTHLPMWEVRRPRTWRHLDWSLEQIVQIGSAGGDEGLLEEQLRVGTGVR